MSLEKSLNKIKNFMHDRYVTNLAGLLVFGSANTGHFKEGNSDIDTMIFLKQLKGLNLDKESKFLFDALRPEHFHTQYFHTLDSIRDYLRRRKSFSTYITIVSDDGSRVLYSTPEFDKLKKELTDAPFSRKDIKDFIKEKDAYELDGYFKEINDYQLTKALMAHVRRKLQIINYFKTGKLIFDYEKCLDNIDLDKELDSQLEYLYNMYVNRKSLSDKQVKNYYNLARQITEIMNI